MPSKGKKKKKSVPSPSADKRFKFLRRLEVVLLLFLKGDKLLIQKVGLGEAKAELGCGCCPDH